MIILFFLWRYDIKFCFLHKGGRQSGAILYNSFGMMGKSGTTDRSGMQKSNDSSDSPTGSGYSTDVSDDNIPCDGVSPSSDINGNSVSDEQVKHHTPLIFL